MRTDPNGESTRYDAAGRVTSITTNNGETTVAFDNRGDALMKLCSRTIRGFVLLALACTVGARDDGSLLKQIQDTIGTIRVAETLDARARAADRLANITEKIDPSAIDDKTFADLVALMDSPDDVVRAGVAAALVKREKGSVLKRRGRRGQSVNLDNPAGR